MEKSWTNSEHCKHFGEDESAGQVDKFLTFHDNEKYDSGLALTLRWTETVMTLMSMMNWMSLMMMTLMTIVFSRTKAVKTQSHCAENAEIIRLFIILLMS